MLYFILNYKSLFLTVDFFKQFGFHENSFVIGPLYKPEYLNILNLPNNILDDIKTLLSLKIKRSEHYLKNSYQNILKYISDTPWNKDIASFTKNISLLDIRRKQSAEKTFPDLFKELNRV
jgi:hypothetical protein